MARVSISFNSTCPRCGRPAQLRNYPAKLNGGKGSRSYWHAARRGLFGMTEITDSCEFKGDVEEAERAKVD